ncbi:MurR/RpiR family transcriptional regulator [Aidingimonas lacisalsi]|uniref:MurR/RpiR family transcriptional regulator n=1 Tax=Aidingimonas lacisalsi TaxID=2604086 RepID=UPI001375E000|nr:MurR/RpiR family transcriptional regulator [Aidingimonas lacisalsi]
MDTMKEPITLEARIQAHYESLPPAEKRLGDLLLNFPGDIANYSAGELAETAGTSKAAASRFFQRLGYRDFSEARRQVREAKQWGSPVYLSSSHRDDAAMPSQFLADHLHQETLNLTRTLEAIRPDVLRDVADALARARRVQVVGFRNSRMLALYLQRQLLLMRPDVSLLPQAGQTLGEDLVDMGEQDVLVVIGMRRRVAAIARLIEIARDSGARILLVADPSATQASELATWTLNCQVRSSSLLDSYSAAMSVLNLLCITLFERGQTDRYSRLRRIESLHDELEELDAFAWLKES